MRMPRAELKALMPEDAKEAIGHGVRGKRSKIRGGELRRARATEAGHAPLQ